jgi:hypothetical protein
VARAPHAGGRSAVGGGSDWRGARESSASDWAEKPSLIIWGKNKHDQHKDIQKRHLITTAQACGLKHGVNELFEETISQAPQAFAHVQAQLPAGFQIQVLDKTIMGIQATLKKLV